MKRYVLLAVLLLGIMVLRFGTAGDELQEVEAFRGANIRQSVFHPLMAESVNGKHLTVTINGKVYDNTRDQIYMNNQMELMVPIQVLRDALNCSAHVYDRKNIRVQKNQLEIRMTLDKTSMKVIDNGKTQRKKLVSKPVTKEGLYYVPLQNLDTLLSFTYTWNVEKNAAVVQNNSETDSFLPYKYDLRSQNRVGVCKDQGNYGTCWAFASLSALESTLLPEVSETFSADHMSLRNSFSSDQSQGGEYTMGMAYLTAWQGPVLEQDDPYGDGKSPDGLRAVRHVQEIQVLNSKDLNKIKAAVFQYGGVQTSIYNTMDMSQAETSFYNPDAYAYCYQGEAKPNHDIVIIGWDDSFDRNNFNTVPEDDGAFLCQNSWGTEFGDKGTFYVSYYDSNVGIHSISYTGIEGPDNYDRIYQSDLCGWVGQLGYNKDTIYAANEYTAKDNEVLKAVGFYATGPDTEYEVYVSSNVTDTDSFSYGRLCASGTLQNVGYYTIQLDRIMNLMKGKQYAVMVKLHTPGSKRPLAVEYASSEVTQDVDLSDGKGYISSKGKKWERVEKEHHCNICLKAYTDIRNQKVGE